MDSKSEKWQELKRWIRCPIFKDQDVGTVAVRSFTTRIRHTTEQRCGHCTSLKQFVKDY